MRRAGAALLGLMLLAVACGGAPSWPAAAAAPSDLSALSDEFGDAASLSRWSELSATEGNTNWVRSVDIGTTVPGQLTLVPWVCGWFGDWRGVFYSKDVTGDFDVTTRLVVTGVASEVPVKTFSLAGLMARQAQPGGVAAWTPNRENWLFITAGFGDNRHPGVQQVETKTTRNSESRLELTPVSPGPVELRLVRQGDRFSSYYRTSGQDWQLGQRYVRSDLGATLQVGLAAYTDWEPVGAQDPKAFNTGPLLMPGDLVVHSDYVRYRRPV